MSGQIDTERVLDAFLAPEAERLPERTLDAALDEVARTPQRRALRVPWRFPLMSKLSSTARNVLVAAVLLVALGGGTYLVAGRGPTPTPTPAATPAPPPGGPGIASFTLYTSAIYRNTFGYPSDWLRHGAATRMWEGGDTEQSEDVSYADTFTSPVGSDEIAIAVWRMPSTGSGGDVSTRAGLTTWAAAFVCERVEARCTDAPKAAIQMCLGRAACHPAILVPLAENTYAFFADPANGSVTVVQVARQEGFEGAARYGGTVQLLKSILTTMDVWTPEPGQIPG